MLGGIGGRRIQIESRVLFRMHPITSCSQTVRNDFVKGTDYSRCRRERGQLQGNALVNTEGLGFSAQTEGLVLARSTDMRPAAVSSPKNMYRRALHEEVEPPTARPHHHETGLILSCAGKVGRPCRQSRGIDPPFTIRRGEGA